MNRDDAFEWFGGTADARYPVASNAGDDSLDWTFGWTGRVQFIAVHQRGDDADNGIEADNNEFNNELTATREPADLQHHDSAATRRTGAESPRAVLFRRGTAVTFRNFLIYGFHDRRGRRRDADRQPGRSGEQRHDPGRLGRHLGSCADTAALERHAVRRERPLPECAHERGWRLVAGVLRITPRRTSSRRRSATLAGGQLAPIQPPNDGFFQAVTFIGAVRPRLRDDWTQGWTAYPQN